MLRSMILTVPTIILEMMLMCRLLYRKRSIIPFAVWVYMRIVVQMLQYYFNGAYLFSPNGYAFSDWLFQSVFMVGYAALILWTFESNDGTIVKTLMAALLADMFIGVLGWIVISLVNILEGHEEIMMLYGSAQPLDLLVPIGFSTAVYCLCHFGHTILDAIKDYRIKHKYLISLVVFIVYFNSTITRVFIEYEVIYICLFLCLIIAVFGSMIRYDQHITIESEALKLSNQLLMHHYADLSAHIHDMTCQKQEIDEMMEELVIANFPKESVKQYLDSMYEKREVIAPVSYTEYAMIDALLTSKAEAYDLRKIHYGFHLGGLVLKEMSEIALCYLLMDVFRYMESVDVRQFDMQIFSIRNQVIITVSLDQTPKAYRLKRFVNRSLTKDLFIDIQENAFSLAVSN